jgi:hypothetical protein
MQQRNDDTSGRKQERPNSLEQSGRGPQGVDKAPGEETSKENVQFTQESQKGKKVDRDTSRSEDEPLDRQEIY